MQRPAIYHSFTALVPVASCSMARIAPALAALAVSLLATPAYAAVPPPPATSLPARTADPGFDVREPDGKPVAVDGLPLAGHGRALPAPRTPAATPPIGTVREWLGLD